jgi:hypothetical protein
VTTGWMWSLASARAEKVGDRQWRMVGLVDSQTFMQMVFDHFWYRYLENHSFPLRKPLTRVQSSWIYSQMQRSHQRGLISPLS